MSKKKIILWVSLSIVIVSIVVIAIFFNNRKHYSNLLPEIPDLTAVNDGMKEQITKIREMAASNPSSQNIGYLGMAFYSSDYYDQAAICFELAARKSPGDWQWNYYLGSIKMELGDAKAAIEKFEKVTKENPNVTLAWYRQAEILQQMDSIGASDEILEYITNSSLNNNQKKSNLRSSGFPIKIYTKLLKAQNSISSRNFDKAEGELKGIIAEQITFGQAYKQLGMLYAQQGDSVLSKHFSSRANDLITFTLAEDTLIDKIALISRSESYMLKQMEMALKSGDTRWSLELLSRALTNIPNDKYIVSKCVKQFLHLGVGRFALPHLDKHFAEFSDSYPELVEVGSRLADAGFKQQATRYLEKAKEFTDQPAEKQSTLAGMFFEKFGRREEAFKMLESLIQVNPGNATILGDLIFLCLQTNETNRGMNYIDKLKQIAPSNINIKIFEAILAEKNGNQKKSLLLFEAAFIADPHKRFVVDKLSKIYFDTENWSTAIYFFRKALETYPNDSYLQERLAVLLVTCPDKLLRKLEEGKEFAERAFINIVYTVPTRISAGRTLAIACYQTGEVDKARTYIAKTIELAGKSEISNEYMEGLKNLSLKFSSGR